MARPKAPSVFLLTGAGVSAESGLGTFRDKDGVWTKYDLNEVATPEGFARNPALVRDFYNARRANLAGAAPNAAHLALARLEAVLGNDLFLCTQNVDDLHEKAGSRRVIHMHGELAVTRCHHCQATRPDGGALTAEAVCEACDREGGARPHVVWFGEMPLYMDEIEAALSEADLFVSIGTSGSVYPAAGFMTEARAMGIATCEINLEPSANAYVFDEKLYGPASEVVPAWVEKVLTQG